MAFTSLYRCLCRLNIVPNICNLAKICLHQVELGLCVWGSCWCSTAHSNTNFAVGPAITLASQLACPDMSWCHDLRSQKASITLKHWQKNDVQNTEKKHSSQFTVISNTSECHSSSWTLWIWAANDRSTPPGLWSRALSPHPSLIHIKLPWSQKGFSSMRMGSWSGPLITHHSPSLLLGEFNFEPLPCWPGTTQTVPESNLFGKPRTRSSNAWGIVSA